MNTDRNLSLNTMIQKNAACRQDALALVCGKSSISWHDLNRKINRVASALLGAGLSQYDNVAILGHTAIEYVQIYLGIIRAGCCAVPLPLSATPETLCKMIVDSHIKALAIVGPIEETTDFFIKRLQEFNVPLGISIGFTAEGWIEYERFIENGSSTEPCTVFAPDDAFNIIYSSGTTQIPRGILQSHKMRQFQIERMGRLGFDSDSTTLLATPLYSNTTLIALLPTLAYGGTVILIPEFETNHFLRLSDQVKVTHTMLVPVQYQRLLDCPDFDNFDLSSYKLKCCTGARLSTEIKKDLIHRWPGDFVEIYGQTEGGCTTVLDAEKHMDKLDSVGKPARGVDMRIVDDSGKECTKNMVGEIVGRAVSMMTGYFGQPELTDTLIWRDGRSRVFFRTGDLGYVDNDGFLYLAGRKNDVIVSGGFNVFASDLEKALLENDAVVDAAVIAIPSKRWGETPLGFVEIKPGSSISPDALLTWANNRLGKHQQLCRIVFESSLPRNPAGKILKNILRVPYWD
jgi:acyl-CoA synthetase (AMP-forming)/AMP-acid ligase II